MTIQHIFRNFVISAWRVSVLLGLALLLALATMSAVRSGLGASAAQRTLTLAERVAYQRAIEEVYWRHRIWPNDNPTPKPALQEVLPESVIRTKVEDSLRQSNALAQYWQQPITAEQLQAEIERMAQNTKQPEMLRELYAALGNDPFVIAECLARPMLAERLSRERYATDEQLHGALQQRAAAELQQMGTGQSMPRTSGVYREVEWRADDSEVARLHPGVELGGVLRLDAAHWQEAMQGLAEKFDAAMNELPVGRWSSLQEDAEKFSAVVVLEKNGKRMQVAHVVWQKMPFDTWWNDARQTLSAEVQATGFAFGLTENAAVPEACEGEAWTATNSANAPTARNAHAAVWTGSEMLIWGGVGASTFNTGARYNPATDTWTAMTTTGAPDPRSAPASAWSGVELVVWGGAAGSSVGTGGRYNPTTNSWRSITSTDAPAARVFHTGVWSGSELIVWGGFNTSTLITFTSGGRYNPVTDTWRATTTSQVPASRLLHAAVWAGNEMIIWGGIPGTTGTGGRYNPVSDSWSPVSTSNAPVTRSGHSLVWTGATMIVWGGSDLSTGGQYNPATDSWTATSSTNAPTPRSSHTAIWTGSEMIIWAGQVGTAPNNSQFNSGGRYNPASDTWTATTTTNAPGARYAQTAVWTGNEMIIWGGLIGGATLTRLDTGGRYTISGGLSIAPANQSFPASGGNDTITVTSTSSCNWTAVSNANWITITQGSSGTGNGAVQFIVAANPTTSSRTGTITVTGQIFTVTQAGAPATNVNVSLPTTLAAAPASNLSVPIGVDDLTNKGVTAYDFTLSFDPAVLQLQSTAIDAAGTLSSGFSITPNAATPGRLTVSAFGTTALSGAGTLLKLNFTVIGQAGSSTPLTWQAFRFNEGMPSATTTNGLFTVSGNPIPTLTSLTPNSATAGSAGFTLTVNGMNFVNSTVVRWNGSDRPTTFGSSIQLTAAIPASDLASAGTSSVTAFNPAPGGGVSNALPFTITACSYAIAPTSMSFSSASHTGTVTVTTNATCPWTAVSNVNWLTITAGASGSGNGTVNYAVAANTSQSARIGTITIAGQTFTVNQDGACAITITPTTLPDGLGGVAYNQTLTASGGAGAYSFAVTGGALPNGLTLTSGGVLSGTPTAAGTFNFTITVLSFGPCSGSQAYTLTIAPVSPCNIALNPTSQAFSSAGGDSSVTITTGNQCVWVSLEELDWIEILTSKSGVGSDTLRYRVAANSGGTRTGQISISGQTLTITQTNEPTASMQFRAVSRGAKAQEFPSQYGVASFYKNGVLFHRKEGGGRGGRGFNVAALHPATGELLQPVQVFDTWGTRNTGEAMQEMIRFLNGLPNGTVILIAVADDAGLNLDNSCTFRSSQWTVDGLNTLEQLGSKSIRSYCFQDSFALVAIKGKPELTRDKVGNGVEVDAVMQSDDMANQVACVNAASYKPGAALAPDSIVSAFGPDLSNVDTGQSAPSGVPLPTTLNGSTLKIKDSAGSEQLAQLFYVAKTQINFLMPANIATGNAMVTVTNGAGKISQGTIQIAMVAPGIFTANADGKGPVVGSAIRVKNGVIIGDEPLARYDVTLQKFVGVPLDVSRTDERVVSQIYGTGIRKRTSLDNIIVTIGGVRVPVDYAGMQPSFAGLDQLNIQVPTSLSGRGEVEIVIVVDGQPANIVTITIK